ncbi:MAG TPA: O-antigen ligase family protein, partial [Steroidobacteraceae bacterium]|nr:O-antigen ligase family protein [Steroidobacteraceae bacterium]
PAALRADAARRVDTTLLARAACAGVCVLIPLAPFEALTPLLRVPGQSFSIVETFLLAVIGAVALASLRSRALPELRTPLTAPWLAWLAASAVAALAAAEYRVNALHMVGRFVLAFAVFLIAVNAATSTARIHAMLVAAAIDGAVIGVLVLLEYVSFTPIFALLRLFRIDTAFVGSQVRASGPFQYPTIASMYLEILFALILGLLPIAATNGRRGLLLALVAAVAIVAEEITLTFTRAGLITMATSVAIVLAARVRRDRFDPGARAIAGIAVMIAVQFLASRPVEALRLRMTSEGQDTWYSAQFTAPAEIHIPTGGRMAVPLTVTNSGRVVWSADADRPIRLSYHWLLPDADAVVSWEGLRTPLPAAIGPGSSATVQALVEAPPQPGSYRLLWDIEVVDQLWFSTEPDTTLQFTRATVSGAASGTPPELRPLPRRAERPGRLVLWRAALAIAAAHPLLGAGPDNFRLIYGRYTTLRRPDPRVHSNDMYLEVLAGSGIAGLALFLWLCWRTALVARRAAVQPTRAPLAAYGPAAAAAV